MLLLLSLHLPPFFPIQVSMGTQLRYFKFFLLLCQYPLIFWFILIRSSPDNTLFFLFGFSSSRSFAPIIFHLNLFCFPCLLHWWTFITHHNCDLLLSCKVSIPFLVPLWFHFSKMFTESHSSFIYRARYFLKLIVQLLVWFQIKCVTFSGTCLSVRIFCRNFFPFFSISDGYCLCVYKDSDLVTDERYSINVTAGLDNTCVTRTIPENKNVIFVKM